MATALGVEPVRSSAPWNQWFGLTGGHRRGDPARLRGRDMEAEDAAGVTVTLEIEADIPAGASDQVVRTVTENSRSLKFTSQGFEKE